MRWGQRGALALQRASKFRKSERGQASVMIGMMMMTFILFFTFVIDTGMLVNAKINLQNAADLAAYAGAATQARLLNQISFLNYEMRRQYKKFLFRYYVMGSMAQERFPRDGGPSSGQTAYNFSPDGTLQLGVPMVCIIFNASDNYCHVSQLTAITIPAPNPLDAIQSTLVSQLQQIEAIRQANCAKIGDTNLLALQMWLYNTDPNLDNTGGLAGSQAGSAAVIKGLIQGLGLIPKEMLLWRRIQTLQAYVNHPAEKQVTKEKADGMLTSADPAATERTMQAFYSAYYTLGNHTFSGSDIIMDELTPQTLLTLKDIKAQFDTFALRFPANGGGSNGGASCEPTPVEVSLGDKIPFGVYKDPTVLTYYALRIKAKAKIMFNPFGSDLELKAYAAARPFGSRIGPQLSDTDFAAAGRPTGVQMDPRASVHTVGKVPNLRIGDDQSGDSSALGKGWATVQALGAYYQKFKPPSNGQQGIDRLSVIGQDNITLAYQASMVPNPYEANLYNIPDDLNSTDPFVRYFDTKQQYAFWAPLFPLSGPQDASAQLQTLIDSLMQDNGDPNFGSFKQQIKQNLTAYVGKLRSPQGGEDHETFNVARLNNPIMDRVGDNITNAQPQPVSQMPASIALVDHQKIRSSWNMPMSGNFRQAGRVGYSVKFVSFESLTAKKQTADGQSATWSNSMDTDGEADADIPFIKH